MSIDARKLYADGKGVESEAPLNEIIDVGVFTKQPDDTSFEADNALSMQPQRIHSGRQSFTVIVDQEPRYVGVDAYHKYIDRKPEDNVLKLDER